MNWVPITEALDCLEDVWTRAAQEPYHPKRAMELSTEVVRVTRAFREQLNEACGLAMAYGMVLAAVQGDHRSVCSEWNAKQCGCWVCKL